MFATGPYESYQGSPMSKGQLQHDLWGVQPPSDRCDNLGHFYKKLSSEILLVTVSFLCFPVCAHLHLIQPGVLPSFLLSLSVSDVPQCVFIHI